MSAQNASRKQLHVDVGGFLNSDEPHGPRPFSELLGRYPHDVDGPTHQVLRERITADLLVEQLASPVAGAAQALEALRGAIDALEELIGQLAAENERRR